MADSIEKKLASLRAEIESVSTEAMGYRTCDPNRAYAVKENMLCIIDSISRALSPAGGPELADVERRFLSVRDMLPGDYITGYTEALAHIRAAMLAASPQQEPGADGCGACGDSCANRGACRLADDSPTRLYALAAAIRGEADIADRPGQMARLNAIADELSVHSKPTPADDPSGQTLAGAGGIVPGVMHCAKCKFRLMRTNMHVNDGTFNAGDNKTEPCPNGCGPLWPVTWENEARECWARMEEMSDRLAAATSAGTTGAGGELDLGQFREAVNCWRAVITTAAVNLPFNLAAYRASCGVSVPDRLLALIDSQATTSAGTTGDDSEDAADVVRDAIQHVREQYPEDLFPDNGTPAGNGARMARLTCNNIEREFKKRMEERDAARRAREVGNG